MKVTERTELSVGEQSGWLGDPGSRPGLLSSFVRARSQRSFQASAVI